VTWTIGDLRTIGYFASRPEPRPDLLDAPAVELICTVSECSSPWPDGWMERWAHNELWLFDALATIESMIPAGQGKDFVRYGVKALPVEFTKDGPQPRKALLPMDEPQPEPIPASFVRLGYDLAQWHGVGWECSALSCNGMAARYGANRFCLVDSFELAVQAATDFARWDGKDVEPGPYVVLELWADRVPARKS